MQKEDTSFWRTKKGKDGSLSWEAFPPFPVEKAIRELKPDERGYAYARAIDQEAEPNELTLPERELLRTATNHILELQQWHIRAAEEINKELVGIRNVDDAESLLRDIERNFNSNANKCWTDFTHDQRKLLKEHVDKVKDLREFRAKNEINRHQAVYPESAILFFAFLLMALVIEGVTNASFFPSGLGLFGGFGIAFLVSLGNVVICFLAGRLFLPEINHKRGHRKFIGLALFLLTLVFIFGLHSSVALYREIKLQNPDSDDWVAALSFNPTGLQTMESLLLIAIGFSISVFAIWKGYTFDDPYPGFGPLYRSWKKKDDEVSEVARTYKHKIIDAHNAAVIQVQGIPAALDAEDRQIKMLEGEIVAYFACAISYYNQARQGAIELITKFRRAVQTIRDVPESFPFRKDLVDQGLPELDPQNLEEGIRKTISGRFAQIEAFRRSYRDKQPEVINKLESARDQWCEKKVQLPKQAANEPEPEGSPA